MPRIPKLVNSAFIGDRVVDTARALGVFPSLMATALTPMIETHFPLSRQIECTACVMSRKQRAFVSTARKMGIVKMILERSPDPDLDPSTLTREFEDQGFEVHTADFSQSTRQGILETAQALGRGKIGEKTASRYEKDLQQARNALPANLGKKILVLLGMRQPGTQKEFLLVEERGFLNEAILSPAGCTNVGAFIQKTDAPGEQYDIRVIQNLDGIIRAAPDLIALTCEAAPGLMAIRQYLAGHPEALQVPAIANHAVFNLPHCCHGEPMALPHTLNRWSKALVTP